jgi:RNA polymerase sigma factor (sigma-70 family)
MTPLRHDRPRCGPRTVQLNSGFRQRELRRRLVARAYRVLGSPEDAEDVVQEALLRIHEAELAGSQIHDPEPFALTVTARVAIDQLRSARVRHEYSAGSTLPDPPHAGPEPGPTERAELLEALEQALPVLTELLTPHERAVFLLREAFDYPYAEIAELVGKTEANCRQLVRRARRRLDGQDVRFQAPGPTTTRLARSFSAACEHGNTTAAIRLLAGDVMAGRHPADARARR